jgi:geranylgeranyl pyrophosphate synthase
LSALPALILARLGVSADRRTAMQATLARGLLRMSAGQQIDLALTGSGIADAQRVEASVIGKSGEQCATYCMLAAQLAGLSEQQAADYAEMGRHLGTAGQLQSDCHELIGDPEMRDLAHGARTLPIVLFLARLGEPERELFLTLLDRARHDPTGRLEARDRIRTTATVRRVLVKAELYRQHARRAAARACPEASARRALDRILGGSAPDSESLDKSRKFGYKD